MHLKVPGFDFVALEHQHGDVHAEKHEEQQQHDGFGEDGQGAGEGKGNGHQCSRQNRQPRRAPLGQHRTHHRRQKAFARHAEGQSAGHDHGQQRAVGYRNQRNDCKPRRRYAEPRGTDHVHQGGLRIFQLINGQDHRRAHANQHVHRTRRQQRAEQGTWIDPAHVLDLFGKIGRGFKPHERIERQQRCAENRRGR